MTISRDDPFYSAKSRLQRAEDKISELDTEIWKYRNEHPPALVCELDEPDRLTKTYKFKFIQPFPDSWAHLPIEALEAMRSALDQAAFAAAKLSGNTRLKATQFPIADSLPELENQIGGRKVCKDVPDAIVRVFRSFKPYKGENDTLWALNKLRNSNHTHIIPVIVRGANVRMRHSAKSTAPLTGLAPYFDGAKNEIPFARGPADGQFAFGASPTFLIGFDESAITGRKHAVSFLTAAVNECEEIVQAVETACLQLGFIK
jgi:hypothetical protein